MKIQSHTDFGLDLHLTSILMFSIIDGVIPDSPHSSDDEETSILKSELRRLRERDSNEQKKALLRQMIEEERQMIGEERAASGYTSGIFLQL